LTRRLPRQPKGRRKTTWPDSSSPALRRAEQQPRRIEFSRRWCPAPHGWNPTFGRNPRSPSPLPLPPPCSSPSPPSQVHMHVCTCMHTHMHVCSACVHVFAHTHACTHTHARVNACMHTHTCIHAYTRKCPSPTPMATPAPFTPQVQRRSPWICQTPQETRTTGRNRCWAEARFQLNRWPIFEAFRKSGVWTACPGSSAQPCVAFPNDQCAHFQAYQKSGAWADYPASSAATISAATSPFQATNPPAAPGLHAFASQEVQCDYTGGLGGSGESEPSPPLVKGYPHPDLTDPGQK
jgi:hypothetical protein